jgi:flagellar hook-associated protein 3 FlgL
VRVTTSSFYNNIYGENNKINQQLFDVNQQISSGQKIQYAYEDPSASIDSLRLNDEITTLTQVKTSAQSAYKTSTQTDTTIGEITKTLDSMKVKLINAANPTNSNTSLQAIAKELRGLQSHLLSLANTSIGGAYLFSGTATAQKPIDANGVYHGNDQNLEAFLGSGVKQKYNITGAQLFSGQETQINRNITTNVPQLSLTQQYPDIMQDPSMARNSGTPTYISPSSTIRDLMGDTDNITTNDPRQAHFYVQGTKTDGTTFKQQLDLNTTDTVDNLLQKISNIYGTNQVNVSMNANGQIEIQDKHSGSSKLDFQMVGAIDFNPVGADTANVTNIDSLQAGTTDFQNVVSIPPANLLYVKEFTKSGFTTPSGVPNTIEGINYDRTNFTQSGAQLSSNVSQIVKSDNSFAIPSTKLLDVASPATLNAQQLTVSGKTITGALYTMQIDLKTAGSTFSLDGGTTNYSIFDTNVPRAAVNADTMTYQQLMDVVNMATTNSLPAAAAPGSAAAYDAAITTANTLGSITLDASGKITFNDKTAPVTKAQMSIYDSSSSNFTGANAPTGIPGSILNFNANNALTISDPKTNFFATIEETIKSVEEGKTRADGTSASDPRNVGIQNSIQKIDDLNNHVTRMQTEAGSYSQVLQASSDRTDMLIVSTKTLQSSVMDTDVAQATLQMTQLTTNYQAMLSGISKISKLSLVNYL